MAASWGSTARCISPMIPPTTRSFTSPRGTWVSARSTRGWDGSEPWCAGTSGIPRARASRRRSEEHTSELQSQSNLVCRLLLEKQNTHHRYTTFQISNHKLHSLHVFLLYVIIRRIL